MPYYTNFNSSQGYTNFNSSQSFQRRSAVGSSSNNRQKGTAKGSNDQYKGTPNRYSPNPKTNVQPKEPKTRVVTDNPKPHQKWSKEAPANSGPSGPKPPTIEPVSTPENPLYCTTCGEVVPPTDKDYKVISVNAKEGYPTNQMVLNHFKRRPFPDDLGYWWICQCSECHSVALKTWGPIPRQNPY